jgi:hypothetical protein
VVKNGLETVANIQKPLWEFKRFVKLIMRYLQFLLVLSRLEFFATNMGVFVFGPISHMGGVEMAR